VTIEIKTKPERQTDDALRGILRAVMYQYQYRQDMHGIRAFALDVSMRVESRDRNSRIESRRRLPFQRDSGIQQGKAAQLRKDECFRALATPKFSTFWSSFIPEYLLLHDSTLAPRR
jgi:hypothetical protein